MPLPSDTKLNVLCSFGYQSLWNSKHDQFLTLWFVLLGWSWFANVHLIFLLPLLLGQVRVGIMITETRPVLIALPTDYTHTEHNDGYKRLQWSYAKKKTSVLQSVSSVHTKSSVSCMHLQSHAHILATGQLRDHSIAPGSPDLHKFSFFNTMADVNMFAHKYVSLNNSDNSLQNNHSVLYLATLFQKVMTYFLAYNQVAFPYSGSK